MASTPAKPLSPRPAPRRGGRVPTAMIPATAIITVAIMLLLNRALVSDWQGLMTETRQRLGSAPRAGAKPPAARPAPALDPGTAAALAGKAPEAGAGAPTPAPAEAQPAPAIAAVEAAAAPIPVPPGPAAARAPEAPAPADPEAGTAPAAKADAPPPADAPAAPAGDTDTERALADIRREAEQRKAEQAELEALRKKADEEAKAHPPRRRVPEMVPFFGRMAPADPRLRDGWIRQQALVEAQIREMARQHRAAQAEMDAFLRQMAPELGPQQGARAWPPGGLVVPMPPAPGVPFGDQRGLLRQWGLPPLEGDGDAAPAGKAERPEAPPAPRPSRAGHLI